ncbi:MAG: hypothetical protein WD231_00815 [Candidatus Woykebacteria bacterium]
MKCPVCGEDTIEKDGKAYCPSCNIFLGDVSSIPQFGSRAKEEEAGKIFQKRAKKSFRAALLTIFLVLLIVSPIAAYLGLNFTSFGYREKVFYKYGFTAEASSYLRRKTSIFVVNISETRPFGFTHSGYWSKSAGGNSIKLNTANDEVAVHELAHAWWDKISVDKSLKQGLVNDTIRLSKLNDSRYNQAVKKAGLIVSNFCNCLNPATVNYKGVDDHHFYAYMAQFTMGNFKDGPHQLPSFMWKYFDSMFLGKTRVVSCYETKSCGFPDDNDL